jgi:hypothetical protein
MRTGTVAINEIMFFEAFERDVDFHDSYPQSAWPDLEAGDVTCKDVPHPSAHPFRTFKESRRGRNRCFASKFVCFQSIQLKGRLDNTIFIRYLNSD